MCIINMFHVKHIYELLWNYNYYYVFIIKPNNYFINKLKIIQCFTWNIELRKYIDNLVLDWNDIDIKIEVNYVSRET